MKIKERRKNKMEINDLLLDPKFDLQKFIENKDEEIERLKQENEYLKYKNEKALNFIRKVDFMKIGYLSFCSYLEEILEWGGEE